MAFWLEDGSLQIEPPKKTRKITGTRFASVLNLNKWSTPFQTWCEITGAYRKPFEDTIYTIAGKTIEPLQADWLQFTLGLGDSLVRPEDIYGANPFKTTFGDFFNKEKILGGMWDYLIMDEDGNPDIVVECKTTKRVEDWKDDIPEYYAQQAALYAHLLGVDKVMMLCTFLEETDYDHPEAVEVSSENTIMREFKLSERYPDFEDKVNQVLQWHKDYVETGHSPVPDEKVDKEYLTALRTAHPQSDELTDLTNRAFEIKTFIDTLTKDLTKELKALETKIKEEMSQSLTDETPIVTVEGSNSIWTLTTTESTKLDKDALERDGLLEKYQITSKSTKLTKKGL